MSVKIPARAPLIPAQLVRKPAHAGSLRLQVAVIRGSSRSPGKPAEPLLTGSDPAPLLVWLLTGRLAGLFAGRVVRRPPIGSRLRTLVLVATANAWQSGSFRCDP